MKFPITRKSLQEFDFVKDQEELKEKQIQKRLEETIEQLCEEFKRSMSSNSKEKKFVWRKLQTIRLFRLEGVVSGTHLSTDEYISEFIKKLKEVFIDCDIIIDPLKTYLIIDWS
jgi:3-deoxy-D-manno-octulosonic-acid transferase